ELNRLDIKNRTPTPREAEDRLLAALEDIWPRADALIVLDQVREPDSGVVTSRVRDRLAGLGARHPTKLVLADSRDRVEAFRNVWLKPNQTECVRAIRGVAEGPDQVRDCAIELARLCKRPVFCTCGAEGTLVVDSRGPCERVPQVPAYPVH